MVALLRHGSSLTVSPKPFWTVHRQELAGHKTDPGAGGASDGAKHTGPVIVTLQTSTQQIHGVLCPTTRPFASWGKIPFSFASGRRSHSHTQVRCYGVLRADFAVPARWKPNSTPLHIAAARGSTSMVKHMLQSFVRCSLCPSCVTDLCAPC